MTKEEKIKRIYEVMGKDRYTIECHNSCGCIIEVPVMIGDVLQFIEDNDIEKQRYKCLRFTEPYKFLTKKEKKKFLNGEDIFLSYERLQGIFKNTVTSIT